jgi:hypothetical protein
MGGRRNIHMLGFAVIIVVTVYVILDLEYLRLGLIRVDAVDQILVELRQSIKSAAAVDPTTLEPAPGALDEGRKGILDLDPPLR